MKTSVFKINNDSWETHSKSQKINETKVNLVLCFSSKKNILTSNVYNLIRKKFQHAHIAITSTAGEIFNDEIYNDSIVVVAFQFEATKVLAERVNMLGYDRSFNAGLALGKKIPKEELKYILILSDGNLVNGSELVKGLSTNIPKDILITGGLAGDGFDFNSTLLGLNEAPKEGEIIAVAFYGDHIVVGAGSDGGWQPFGLEKRITNSSKNVLYELEDKNALELYKKYLGPEAENLPGSALLYPLSIIKPGSSKPVVRTILSIDEEDKSMTFAGDVPVGSLARFMKADYNKLVEAASQAANYSLTNGVEQPDFALLVSSVGRKNVLDRFKNEEVHAVANTFPSSTILAGFYSYGEIAPFNEGGTCQLHNQTMTITTFYEK